MKRKSCPGCNRVSRLFSPEAGRLSHIVRCAEISEENSMTANRAARAFRVGIAGPVGSGKTALVDRLSRRLWPKYNLAVVTNDIYTREDAEFLLRQGTLP